MKICRNVVKIGGEGGQNIEHLKWRPKCVLLLPTTLTAIRAPSFELNGMRILG